MATTNITTPLADGVTPERLLEVLHDHMAMIDALAPAKTDVQLVSGDPAGSGPVMYNVTAPTPIGKSTYPLTFTNVADGVDTLVQPKPPVGKLEIRSKWRIVDGKLKEDVEIDGNFMTKKVARGNVDKNRPEQHKALMQKAASA